MRIIKPRNSRVARREQVEAAIGMGMLLDNQSRRAVANLIDSKSAAGGYVRKFIAGPKRPTDKINRRFGTNVK